MSKMNKVFEDIEEFQDEAGNQGSTIDLYPKDQENPYAMISRALIRDNTISPDCRMLLIFLLSNDEKKFMICTSQICQFFNGYMGRDKVRKLISEAIQAGYIMKENGNLKLLWVK